MNQKNSENIVHILLLEDEEILRSLISDMLEDDGYKVIGMSTCAEARACFSREFSVGLIDLGLPDGNGLSVLAELKEASPYFVPIILTGDIRPESIIETLRAGAFDYLTKPIDRMTLRAALVRAIEHHNALRERDHFVNLLREEREQLKVRVEEATEDIRRYAARRNALLRLAQVSRDTFEEETLFSSLFNEIRHFHPIRCLALCAPDQNEFIVVSLGADDKAQVSTAEGHLSGIDDRQRREGTFTNGQLYDWVREYGDINPSGLTSVVIPQTFWGRTVCTLAFFFEPGLDISEECREFLGMCAHFVASEWEEAHLFLHATQQASLGNIALEMSRGFIQGLTAIRTATEYVKETEVSEDALEGLEIVEQNAEQLQRQLQEFGKLCTSSPHAMETVHLKLYIEQALELLSMAVRSRGIDVIRDYSTDGSCLLLNGTTLARTFHDLLSCAVRTVEGGGTIRLQLKEQKNTAVLFEMSYGRMPDSALDGTSAGKLADATGTYSRFLLAQRTISSCGGKLVFGYEREGLCSVRVLLPRNALEFNVSAEIPN